MWGRTLLGATLALVVAASGCRSASGALGKAPYSGLRTHLDLMQVRHLAEIDHGGWYLDFGTPAQAKYTVGDWRSGWLGQGADGDITFSYVGIRGRTYFEADGAEALIARVVLRRHGTRALTPYLNNKQLQSIHFRAGESFEQYDIPLPAEHVRPGENYLLFTFGGTTPIDGEQVSVAMSSVHILRARSASHTWEPPSYGALQATVRIDKQERKALVVNRPTTLRYQVQVPPRAKLGVGVALEGEGEARARIIAQADGEPRRELFGTKVGAEWDDQVIDLSAYAGKVVRLDFIAEGAAGPGRVAWSYPRILLQPIERQELKPAKNVVVLLIDTLRADKLRPFNAKTRVKTPIIDAVAAEGVIFETAQSPENWTKPAVASVLTGLHPLTHQQKQGDSKLPGSALLLSEHLQQQGFDTGSFIANGYVSDRFGFDQGWDQYTNYIREGKSTEAANVFKQAADWIEQRKDERFFAYIQTIDPHVPYDPPGDYLRMYDPSPYTGAVRPRMTGDLLEKAKRRPPAVTFTQRDKEHLVALHDGEITQHDHFLGKFIERLKAMGIWEDTLLVITSDHGEEFDDHGSWGHGHSIYQELLHVPLMFRLTQRLPAGARVPEVVSTMDIPATVLELIGAPPMPDDEGKSLVPFMLGDQPPGPPVAFSDFQDDRRVITAGHWKFLLRGNLTSTMFDLQADPRERAQLSSADRPIARRYCRTMLSQFLGAADRGAWWHAEQGKGAQLGRENAEMDETIRGQLRALGYAH